MASTLRVFLALVVSLGVTWITSDAFVVRSEDWLDLMKRAKDDDASARRNTMQQRAWAAKSDPMYYIGKRTIEVGPVVPVKCLNSPPPVPVTSRPEVPVTSKWGLKTGSL